MDENQKAEKVILVAGWFTLTNLEKEEEQALSSWVNTPMDFTKVKSHAEKFIAILSDSDPYVPLAENRRVFEEQLGAQIFVEHNKGHFNEMPQERPNLLKFIY